MSKVVAVLAFGTLAVASAYAGGDIVPVETTPAVAEETGAFYGGLGMGQLSVKNDFSREEIDATMVELSLGYQVSSYFAVEGRYALGFNTTYDQGNVINPVQTYDGKVSHWGVYFKPQYAMGDFSLYGLLGFGQVRLNDFLGDDAVEEGFQWGLGGSYAVTEHWNFYGEYLWLYDDKGFDYVAKQANVEVNAWTFGVQYRF